MTVALRDFWPDDSTLTITYKSLSVSIEALTDGFEWTFQMTGPTANVFSMSTPPLFSTRLAALAGATTIVIEALDQLGIVVRQLLDDIEADQPVDVQTHPARETVQVVLTRIINDPERAAALDPTTLQRIRSALDTMEREG